MEKPAYLQEFPLNRWFWDKKPAYLQFFEVCTGELRVAPAIKQVITDGLCEYAGNEWFRRP